MVNFYSIKNLTSNSDSLPLSRVLRTWWPLALSWLLMSAEPAALAAVVARMANPEINLAAYGSVAFAIQGLVQAPLISLLSLSTALSRDYASYKIGQRLMNWMGIGITLLFGLVAFTPVFDLIVKYLIGAPQEIVEPARISLMVGLPWAYAVGYRRFHQGVLIRFNRSRDVTLGTLSRFFADALVLLAGYLTAALPGAVLATLMMVIGVNTDALYVHFRSKSVLREEVQNAPPSDSAIAMRTMLQVYFPLALTPLLSQLVRPMGSAALSRLPDPITALAIWPVISAFSGLLVTPATALNETVNALIDQPGARKPLIRFIILIGVFETAAMVLIAATPLAAFWFRQVSGLEADSTQIATLAFWMLVPGGILSPLAAWFSGAILNSRKTRAITEGMLIYLLTFAILLALGSTLLQVNGIYLVTGSSTLSSTAQIAWLGIRSRKARGELV